MAEKPFLDPKSLSRKQASMLKTTKLDAAVETNGHA